MNYIGLRWRQLLACALFVSVSLSQAAEVDLELIIEKTPLSVTESGEGGSLVFTITNYGPDISGNGISTGSVGISSEYMPINDPYTEQLPIVLERTEKSDCLLHLSYAEDITPSPHVKFLWGIRPVDPILPGETRICYFNYVINDISRVENYFFDFSWTVWTVTESDTNAANNTFTNRYYIARYANSVGENIPTLTGIGYIFLVLLVMLGAAKVIR